MSPRPLSALERLHTPSCHHPSHQLPSADRHRLTISSSPPCSSGFGAPVQGHWTRRLRMRQGGYWTLVPLIGRRFRAPLGPHTVQGYLAPPPKAGLFLAWILLKEGQRLGSLGPLAYPAAPGRPKLAVLLPARHWVQSWDP